MERRNPVFLLILIFLFVTPVIADDCGCGGSSSGSAAGTGTDDPRDVILLVRDARDLADRGHLNESLVIYQDILRTDPSYLPALRGVAGVLRDLGRIEESLTVVDRILLDDPTDAAAWSAKSDLFRISGNEQAADYAYFRAIELDPDLFLPQANRTGLPGEGSGETTIIVQNATNPAPATTNRIIPATPETTIHPRDDSAGQGSAPGTRHVPLSVFTVTITLGITAVLSRSGPRGRKCHDTEKHPDNRHSRDR
jgi:tetratricopeptide (TPR) repeat protein